MQSITLYRMRHCNLLCSFHSVWYSFMSLRDTLFGSYNAYSYNQTHFMFGWGYKLTFLFCILTYLHCFTNPFVLGKIFHAKSSSMRWKFVKFNEGLGDRPVTFQDAEAVRTRLLIHQVFMHSGARWRFAASCASEIAETKWDRVVWWLWMYDNETELIYLMTMIMTYGCLIYCMIMMIIVNIVGFGSHQP